jgi:hypothetical protein
VVSCFPSWCAPKADKLSRASAYQFLKAINNALCFIGTSLDAFLLQDTAVLRPVQCGEVRVKHHTLQVFVIVDLVSGTFTLEIPSKPQAWKLLCCHIDECCVGLASFWYATLKRRLLGVAIGDCYHRDWNDIKLAFKRSGTFWRTLIEMCFVVLLPYGPWKSSDYQRLRQETLEHMLKNSTWRDSWFQSQAELFAKDLGMDPPTTETAMVDLYSKLAAAKSFSRKGPMAKMMRWFSFFDALDHQLPDIHLSKQVYKYHREAPREKTSVSNTNLKLFYGSGLRCLWGF